MSKTQHDFILKMTESPASHTDLRRVDKSHGGKIIMGIEESELRNLEGRPVWGARPESKSEFGTVPQYESLRLLEIADFIVILLLFPFVHSSQSTAPFGTNKIGQQRFRADLETNTVVCWQSLDRGRGTGKQIKKLGASDHNFLDS